MKIFNTTTQRIIDLSYYDPGSKVDSFEDMMDGYDDFTFNDEKNCYEGNQDAFDFWIQAIEDRYVVEELYEMAGRTYSRSKMKFFDKRLEEAGIWDSREWYSNMRYILENLDKVLQ
jgi:hypothetical protein